MRDRIVLAALDANKNDINYKKLKSLSADQQIKQIENSIRDICADLSKREPDAMWIVSWREYGISDGDSRFLSPEAKQLLKSTMQNLTKEFRNLAIISGTVPTKRHFDQFESKEKLEQLTKAYAESEWLAGEEKKAEDEQVFLHLQKVDRLKQEENKEGIDVVRNTCYVFQGGEIQRHDKTAPYLETLLSEDADVSADALNNIVFQPGRGKTNNPIITLVHPSGKEFKVGIEICREHRFGTLKNRSPDEKPLIHLVMSDGMDIFLDKLHGVYAMHLDSYAKPKLILSKEVLQSQQVKFYRMNLLEDEKKLIGPLQPLYPFEFYMLDLLNAKLAEFPSKKSQKYQVLDQLREKVIANLGKVEASTYYDSLLDEIEKNYALLTAPRSMLEGVTSFFFTPEPDTTKLANELNFILLKQREINLNCKDYLTQREAPEIKEVEDARLPSAKVQRQRRIL